MADQSDVGAHCETCGRQDFLPVTCAGCQRPFCKDHFKAEEHHCMSLATGTDTLVGHSIPEDRSLAISKVCVAVGCKERLGLHNQVHCSQCDQDVCVRHRFETDHPCVSLDDRIRLALRRAFEEVALQEQQMVLETLTKIFRNVLDNPANEKFRSLKKANALVQERLRHPAALALLMLAGFEDAGDTYVCVGNSDLTAVRKLAFALEKHVQKPDLASAKLAGASGLVAGVPAGGSRVTLKNGVIHRSPYTASDVPVAPQCDVVRPSATRPKPAVSKNASDFQRRGLSAEDQRKVQEDALRQAQLERKQKFKGQDGALEGVSPVHSATSPSSEQPSTDDGRCLIQ